MIPVVAIVGRSGSGKTVLMEKLISEFKSRGFRVAAVKHVHTTVNMDTPGKDTWRFSQAGSDAEVVASPERITVFRHSKGDAGLDEAVDALGQGYDIILAEGFKNSKSLKIEVHDSKQGQPLFSESELLAVVTDEKTGYGIPCFTHDNAAGIADLIEKRVIERAPSDMSITVNGRRLSLKPFVKDIIASSIIAMLGTLKNVGIIRNAVISIRNKV